MIGWFIVIGIIAIILFAVREAVKDWNNVSALRREVRERRLERLVFNEDESADPDVKVGHVDGIKVVLYWDEECFETAKELLKWRDRSPASILRLKLDALEMKNGEYLFSHRWGASIFSTLSEVRTEDDRKRKEGRGRNDRLRPTAKVARR